jgi:hypothetical protein
MGKKKEGERWMAKDQLERVGREGCLCIYIALLS